MDESKGVFQFFLMLYTEFEKIEAESGYKIIQDTENPLQVFILDSNENFLEKFSLEEYIKELQNDTTRQNTSIQENREGYTYTQRVERAGSRAIERIRGTIEEREGAARAGSRRSGGISRQDRGIQYASGKIRTINSYANTSQTIQIHRKLKEFKRELTEFEKQKAINTYKQIQESIQAPSHIQATPYTQAELQIRLDRNLNNYSKSQELKYLNRCNVLAQEAKSREITLDSKSLKLLERYNKEAKDKSKGFRQMRKIYLFLSFFMIIFISNFYGFLK